jgi:hypothetical protein
MYNSYSMGQEAGMHPEIERELARQRMEDLRRAGAATGGERVKKVVRLDREVVLRGSRHGDQSALMALAVLDDSLPPVGPSLVAEVDGAIVAVLPLDGGRPYSDPFRRTDDLIALLEERARQIMKARAAGARRRHFAWLSPATLRRHA